MPSPSPTTLQLRAAIPGPARDGRPQGGITTYRITINEISLISINPQSTNLNRRWISRSKKGIEEKGTKMRTKKWKETWVYGVGCPKVCGVGCPRVYGLGCPRG
jgi:hypothetical protein